MTIDASSNPGSLTSFDKKFAYIAYGLLILVVLYTSYLHQLSPQVLNVPSNTDVSRWTTPLEQTCIYDRMTEAERAKVRAEGIPLGDNLWAQFFGWPPYFIGDVLTFLMGLICFLHARKYYGSWMASCFFIGSFVFTGLEESMWILLGRKIAGMHALNALGEVTYGSYWFTKGVFWFFEAPVMACISWFFIAYSCVLVAGKVFPKRGLWFRAAVGGLIAMGIDLWVDPVQTSPELMNWVWAKGDVLYFLGIPHTNFVGWFLLIALFAVFWEKLPALDAKYGRLKASIYFFLGILITEIGILIFFMIWLPLIGAVLKSAGVTHAIQIPSGW